jgi:chromate transport protein ChrA
MDNLSLGIFVVPIITLTLIIIFYIHFLRKVENKRKYQYFIVTTAVAAFILNLVWELAHGSLYKGFQYDLGHIAFCALASVADMFMVLILLFAFGLIYKNVLWIEPVRFDRSLVLILVGGVGAILAEMWHTSRGDWSYADAMPLIPIVEVGLSPVLQFTILPLIIFVLTKKLLNL